MRSAELEGIRRDIAQLVGPRHVSVHGNVRAIYGRDCWPRSLLWVRRGELRYKPDVVVWPGSTDEVARVVRYARENHLPITPYGAGSSVVAGAVPLRAGITLDTKRMRRLVSVDVGERRAVAQTGINGQRLEDGLQLAGATLGHFPSSIYCSTLGGWIAARGAGQFSSYYGKIEDMVLGLTAVAGTGEVLKVGPERVPGPDLLQLLVGSEGTLGVITDSTLRIHPKPTAKAVRGLHLRSVAAGVETMRQIFRAGLRPHLLRLYDPLDTVFAGGGSGDSHDSSSKEAPGRLQALAHALRTRSLGYALSSPQLINRMIDLVPPRCLMVLSFEGEHQSKVEEELRAAMDIAREQGGSDLGEGPALRWYRKRHSTSYKQSGVFAGRAWADTMEVCATWDKVVRIFEAVRQAARHEAVVLCHWSHAYLEGCSLYFTFVGPAVTSERGEAGYERTWALAQRAALDAGATLSHHHGVGAARVRYLPDELGDSGMRLLRALKSSFDPDGILNPGKLVA